MGLRVERYVKVSCDNTIQLWKSKGVFPSLLSIYLGSSLCISVHTVRIVITRVRGHTTCPKIVEAINIVIRRHIFPVVSIDLN